MSDTANTAQGRDEAAAAPAPLLRLLQFPGLPGTDADAPVCGPHGCAVPGPAEQR
ncbi:hypothetical protein ABH931_006273 [Streptacidiphilus sp. MAP12-33]|uniref:hypothetical protein n=1 Tax=Streptacidiphilus sp. MAP12-33 TaxID=3156266 RepID=UPI003515F18A